MGLLFTNKNDDFGEISQERIQDFFQEGLHSSLALLQQK